MCSSRTISSPGGDRREGCRRRGSGCRRSWRRCWPTNSRASSAASIRSSSVRRSAGRCSTASAARTSRKVREIAMKLAQVVADEPAGRARQLRLDRAGAAAAHPRRPGRGAAAGPELAGARERAQHGHLGRRRSRRCATTSISSMSSCARPTSSASRSTTLRTMQVPLPGGRTVPLSQFATFELRAGDTRWSGGATGCRR